MKHNTEVEEAVKEFLEQFSECPQDLIGHIWRQEDTDEFNRARQRGAEWLRTTLHHQLQKARQDWLREEIVRLKKMESGNKKDLVQWAFINQDAKDLIADTTLRTIQNRHQSELDQDIQLLAEVKKDWDTQADNLMNGIDHPTLEDKE